MEILKLVLIGIALGVSNVIPGVSGGTMAVVFNVYDRILALISFNIKKIFREWKFILPLVFGMALGIVGFSKAVSFLFEKFTTPTTYFFIGLILGSIPLVWKKIIQSGSGEKKLPVSEAISFLIGLAAVLCMLIFHQDKEGAKQAAGIMAETSLSLDASMCAILFFGGAAAAVAMIIPGISGSFLLLALGLYQTIIFCVSRMKILLLIPFALGMCAGLVFGAALVRLLLAKIPRQTYSAILGLVAGSVVLLFPGAPLSVELVFCILTLAAGFLISFLFGRSAE